MPYTHDIFRRGARWPPSPACGLPLLADNGAMPAARDRSTWTAIRRLTLASLAIWLLLSVVGPWFARALNGGRLFGFPAGYWLVAQGTLLLFIVVGVVFVLLVERIEARALQVPAQTPPTDTPTHPQ